MTIIMMPTTVLLIAVRRFRFKIFVFYKSVTLFNTVDILLRGVIRQNLFDS